MLRMLGPLEQLCAWAEGGVQHAGPAHVQHAGPAPVQHAGPAHVHAPHAARPGGLQRLPLVRALLTRAAGHVAGRAEALRAMGRTLQRAVGGAGATGATGGWGRVGGAPQGAAATSSGPGGAGAAATSSGLGGAGAAGAAGGRARDGSAAAPVGADAEATAPGGGLQAALDVFMAEVRW